MLIRCASALSRVNSLPLVLTKASACPLWSRTMKQGSVSKAAASGVARSEVRKKGAPHRGKRGETRGLRNGGEALKPRPARQRRQIGKVRAGLPYPSLNAAAFSSSAGVPNG